MKHHVRLVILAALLCAVLTPEGFAATATVNGITWNYTVSGTASVYGGWYSSAIQTSTTGAITIPSTLGGYSVTSIGSFAFYNCSGLTSVTIPDSVTSIGSSAFDDCRSLTLVTIPDSVTSIGSSAFDGCRGLTSVTIPDSVTSIGERAFDNCYSLFDISSIPGVRLVDGWAVGHESSLSGNLDLTGCRGIGNYAFSGCSGLTSVTIPDSVTSIGSFAFYNCSGLTSVTIPDSVTSIGNSAFYNCCGLTSFVVNENNPNYSSVNGLLLSQDGKTLIAGVNGDVVIPDSVTSIGEYAFYNCSGLTSVTIPDSVTSIGDYAFCNCSGLKAVTIGNGVTNIGGRVFEGCSGLTSVTIPDSVTSIDSQAFTGCSKLYDTTSISGVKLIDGWVVGCDDTSLSGKLDLSGVRGIGECAFYYCYGLTSVTIPDSVTSIGYSVFRSCDSLANILIPPHLSKFAKSLKSGNSATVFIASPATNGVYPVFTFSDNSLPSGQIGKRYATWVVADGESSNTVYSVSSGSLPAGLSLSPDGLLSGNPTEAVQNQSVTISTSDGQSHTFTITIRPVDYGWLTSGIWKYEVENDEAVIRFCTQQTGSVTVPETINGYPVRSIEAVHVADYDVDGVMTNIFIPEVVFEPKISLVSLPSNLRNFGTGAVAGSSISSLNIPNGVTNIGYYAATLCSNMVSMAIGSGVKSIQDAAFHDCASLRSVSIPNSVVDMGTEAFSACVALRTATVGSGLRSIPKGTFAGCLSLIDVSIPSSITNIEDSAFTYCGSLKHVKLPDSVTAIGFTSFMYCVSLEEFRCPPNLDRMGSWAFGGCVAMTNFTASPLLEELPDYAFTVCNSLGQIAIPEKCRKLGVACFSRCTSLTNIVWNDCLDDIGLNCFSECASLTEMRVPDTVSMIRPATFQGCTNLVSLSLPFVGITTNYLVETEFSGFGAIFGGNPYNGSVEIGQVFGAAGNLSATWFVPESLETVEVRGGMLAPGAFSDCRTLKEIRLSGNPTAIPNFAFFGCDGLEEIAIPDCVTNIGYAAFGNCGSLCSVRMPPNIESVGSVPFWQCTNLVEVSWGDTRRLRMENPEAGWIGLENVYHADGVSGLIWSASTENPRDWMEWFVEGTGELRTTDHYAIVTNGETRSFFVRVTDMSMTAADTDLLHFMDVESAPWIVSKDEAARGGFCLRSGEIPASTNSVMETTVCGKGTLSFKWRISAGRGDYARMYLDGEVQKSIQRVTAWQTVSLDIPAGEHTILWSYERGSGSATGEDAAFLDDVDWRPEVTLAVASAFGTATPDAGTHTFVYGDEVVASAVAPEPENGIRRVCTGWTGTGSASAAGVESGVSFTITNDSSIVWNWRTDYLTGVSVSGGSGDFGQQWVASGETVEVVLSPAAHLYEISLSGDTEGVTLDGTTLRFVADKPRQIDVTITEVKVSLAVGSEWGVPSPTNGVHDLSWGTQVSATIAEPEPTNGVQYVCTGWTGTGSVPESGTGTNIVFTIEADSSIHWNWQTNVWISVAANGPVGVDMADGWFALGEAVVAQYSPNVDFFTIALSGDTDGVVLDESARTIAIPADRPRSVTLSIAELTLKKALDASSLTWGTSGNATWFPQIDVSADGVSSARSGGLSNGDEVSALETTVQGGGTFEWSWSLAANDDSNSGVDVLLDGDWLDSYYPGTDWSRETLEITGDGEHTIRFEFWNAGTETGDCAYLDQVSWSGGVPSHDIVIGDVRIPSDWIDENAASALATANGDYEAAAKAMAANEVNKVWECYVAGISPTNETARFEATIEIVGGKPVVRWNPPLSAEEEAKRIRKVLGKRSLDDPDGWQDVSSLDDPDAAGYRFFKVSVKMK